MVTVLLPMWVQVVVVRGVNPTGHRIIARHIYTHLPPPAPRANQLRQLEASATAAPGLQLSMVAAAGPFCLLEDMSYAPLATLLQQLTAAPPQVLLLLGPFVDVENPSVAGGMMDVTFQQLFQQQVGARVGPQNVP
jgi:DNA polymerase alpha subunit B